MKSISIVLIVEDEEDSWEEEWKDYNITLTEEQTMEEIEEVMAKFNNHRRPYEKVRTVVSFTLSDVYDEDEV